MTDIFVVLNQYQMDLHLFHFQTNSYCGHKASYKHLIIVRDNTDLFLEVFQGNFNKLSFKAPQKLEIDNVSQTEEIVTLTNHLTLYLKTLKRDLKGYSDLENIIDEMIAANNLFLYLLTFQ